MTAASVVVTRAREHSEELADALASHGTDVILLPLIAIADPVDWDDVDRAARRLSDGGYDWIVLASANAVERFAARLERLGLQIPARTKVGAVGEGTKQALEVAGLRTDLVPDRFTAHSLLTSLPGPSGRVLFPRVAGAPSAPIYALREQGWEVDEIEAYRNVDPDLPIGELERVRAGRFDAVTFASGSAARNFVRLVARPRDVGLAEGQEGKLVACIGPQTARVASDEGFRVDVVADEHTSRGLAHALSGFFSYPSG